MGTGKNYNNQTSKSATDILCKEKNVNYELIPPDGGWGYVITISLAVVFNVTLILMTPFGIMYGDFLSKIGDETSGTTLANGIFNSVCSFTGLIANHMLGKMSLRKVGLIGALIYFVGATGIIFAKTLFQMVLFFGVIQGLGFGLIMPAIFTAFDAYFDKRKTFMMNVSQILMVIVTMLSSAVVQFLMETYGFRGTVAILAALSLNCFACMLTLQPVKWHMRKRRIFVPQDKSLMNIKNNEISPHGGSLSSQNIHYKEKVTISNEIIKNQMNYHGASLSEDVLRAQLEPFLEKKINHGISSDLRTYILKPRFSIISIGDRAISVNTINSTAGDKNISNETDEETCFWKSLAKSMELSLLKDPVYLNMSFGLSFSLTADLVFISIVPILLENLDYSTTDMTIFLTVYFGFDLCSRILLAVYSAFFTMNSKYIFLGGSLLSAIFRTSFVIDGGYWYTLTIGAILGFLRCFVQSPFSLVISEAYPDKFASAFSLYMVVNGLVSLMCGPIVTFVKQITGSNTMVVHVLSIFYLLCAIPWSIEIFYRKIKRTP